MVQRKDDTEAVCRDRLDTYHAQTAPLIPFYDARGRIRRVDGVGELDAITQRIFAALGL